MEQDIGSNYCGNSLLIRAVWLCRPNVSPRGGLRFRGPFLDVFVAKSKCKEGDNGKPPTLINTHIVDLDLK